MVDVAKYPFLTHRSGSDNLYYKRSVPTELRAPGRPKQVWKSLGTPDRAKAQRVYAAQHAEIELLFDQWRREDNQPIARADTESAKPSAPNPTVAPLTPALLRKIADSHYLAIYENDFDWRSELWRRTRDNEEAFWSGDVIGQISHTIARKLLANVSREDWDDRRVRRLYLNTSGQGVSAKRDVEKRGE
jgi:hypothetical protein